MFSPNTGKYRPEKTPYMDTFHAVNLQPEKEKRSLRNTLHRRCFSVNFSKSPNNFFSRSTLGNCFCSTHFEYAFDYYFMLMKCFDNSYRILKKTLLKSWDDTAHLLKKSLMENLCSAIPEQLWYKIQYEKEESKRWTNSR